MIAHGVEDHIELIRQLREVAGCVVDHVGSTELPGPCQFAATANCGDGGARSHCQLQRRRTAGTRGAIDQQTLTRPQLRAAQEMHGRQATKRQRGCAFERQPSRNRGDGAQAVHQLVGRMAAHATPVHAKNGVTRAPGANVLANRINLPGKYCAQHRVAKAAPAHGNTPQRLHALREIKASNAPVANCDGRRHHPHANLVQARNRPGQIAHAYHLRPAILRAQHSHHAVARTL